MTTRFLTVAPLLAALLTACTQTVNGVASRDGVASDDAAHDDAARTDAGHTDAGHTDAARTDAARADVAPERDAPDSARPPPCISLTRRDCLLDSLRVSMTVRAMAVDRAEVLVLGGLAHDTAIGPPPDRLAMIVDRAAVHRVATTPALGWSAGFNVQSHAPPTIGVSAVMPVADVVVAVNEHDCGDDPTRLTGPCIWSITSDGDHAVSALRYRGRYAPTDAVERSVLARDSIEGGDVSAHLSRSFGTPDGRRYAQSAVTGLLGATPAATHDDAPTGRGLLDALRGDGAEARALDALGSGVRVVAENLLRGASSPLPRPLDVTLPGDASIAARLGRRRGAWFVLAQRPGGIACSAVSDGGETLLRDVAVLDGVGLNAPLSSTPAGDAFALDHTGAVRVGDRVFEGPATLVATLDDGCRATAIVDLPHVSPTASAPSVLARVARTGVLYVAQNFTEASDRWSEVIALAP